MSDLPAPGDPERIIVIALDPEDEYTLVVSSPQSTNIEERVNLLPDASWPTPAETNDMVAEAVRRTLDRWWEACSGEPVVRNV